MKLIKGDQLKDHLEQAILDDSFMFEEVISTANTSKIQIYFIDFKPVYTTSYTYMELGKHLIGELYYYISFPTLEKRFYVEFFNGSKHQIVIPPHEPLDEIVTLLNYFFKNHINQG